jgi:hypothetical protein
MTWRWKPINRIIIIDKEKYFTMAISKVQVFGAYRPEIADRSIHPNTLRDLNDKLAEHFGGDHGITVGEAKSFGPMSPSTRRGLRRCSIT